MSKEFFSVQILIRSGDRTWWSTEQTGLEHLWQAEKYARYMKDIHDDVRVLRHSTEVLKEWRNGQPHSKDS